ncbi:MAG: LysR family transcriptional regulator [Solobacterium sp.]|nr:LysR family transcriptional regulator [Solobacterium sp.]
MAITISELEYFSVTAELQNITKAAEVLHLTQPSLSRSISSLEASLQVKLFDRAGRNITLNHYGEIVHTYADRILVLLKAMENELNDATKKEERTISVSISSASSILPIVISEFNQTSPDTHFMIMQNPASSNHSDFSTDFNFFSTTTPVNNDNTVTLLKEDLLLAIPQNYPQATQNSVRLADFAKYGFISLQSGKDLRTITDTYCYEAGFIPSIFLESDSPFTIREFIKAGLGVAFVPEITWCQVREKGIRLMPIRSPKCTRYIHLSWHSDGYLSKQAIRFRDFLINHFEEFALSYAEKAKQEHGESEK